ncbi:MAG: hypothetical protein V4508_11890 [Pseudomonadota bacterium]
MKALWLKLTGRIDALTLRERAILFGGAAAVIVMLSQSFLLSPMFSRRAVLNEQIRHQQNNLAGIDAEITAKVQAYGIDPDLATRQRLNQLRAEIAGLNTSLRSMQQGLVAPDKVVPLLEVILKSNGRLRVMGMRTLPVSGLSDPMPGETALAKAEPPKPTDPAAKPVEAAPALSPGQLLFRHGVEITMEGNYLDMVDYMSALEAMPTQLFWGKAALDVQRYPSSRLTLTLYTLSLDQKWMKL